MNGQGKQKKKGEREMQKATIPVDSNPRMTASCIYHGDITILWMPYTLYRAIRKLSLELMWD
jgi:hypothetical protein